MNFSHSHVRANASFSICAYLDSVSVRALDAIATGLQCSPCLWRRTPPSAYAEASALTLVSLSTSYKASTLGEQSLPSLFGRHCLVQVSIPKLSLNSGALVRVAIRDSWRELVQLP